MPQSNSRSRAARHSADDAKPTRRAKRKSSRSKRPKGIMGYWVEIGMLVLIAAFLCPVVLYNLVNRIPTSGTASGSTASSGTAVPKNAVQKNAVLTPTESFFSKSTLTPSSTQRSEPSISSRFNLPEILPLDRQNKRR